MSSSRKKSKHPFKIFSKRTVESVDASSSASHMVLADPVHQLPSAAAGHPSVPSDTNHQPLYINGTLPGVDDRGLIHCSGPSPVFVLALNQDNASSNPTLTQPSSISHATKYAKATLKVLGALAGIPAVGPFIESVNMDEVGQATSFYLWVNHLIAHWLEKEVS